MAEVRNVSVSGNRRARYQGGLSSRGKPKHDGRVAEGSDPISTIPFRTTRIIGLVSGRYLA